MIVGGLLLGVPTLVSWLASPAAVGVTGGAGTVLGMYLERIKAFVGMGGDRVVGASKPISQNRVVNLSREMREWLGEGARVITNRSGDKIFISQDGLRRIRFDLINPFPHTNPHAHVEQLINGVWRKSGPIFPIDVLPF